LSERARAGALLSIAKAGTAASIASANKGEGMRAILAALGVAASLGLAACQQAQPGPDAVVRALYDDAAERATAGQVTTANDLPLTEELAAALREGAEASQARNEPFIDGDLALGCQDCSDVSPVEVSMAEPGADGVVMVSARFTVDGAPRDMVWHMRETPEGWRVDNIASPDGYDLRASAAEYAAEQSCEAERGAEAAAALVAQCTQVSPATHPPCNTANACVMIENEIARGCGMLTGADKPAFCPAGP
jgi:hypothetical protein